MTGQVERRASSETVQRGDVIDAVASPWLAARHRLRRPVAVVLDRAARASSHRAGVALVYHGVGPAPGDPLHELVPALELSVFEAELGLLAKRYEVVVASALLGRVRERKRGDRFPVAITFDDDLRSHVDHAMPVLQRLGLPATFFLTGASLEGPHSFWWEDLQWAVDHGHHTAVSAFLPSDLVESAMARRPRAIHALRRHIEFLPPRDRYEIAGHLRDVADGRRRPATFDESDVRSLVEGGFEIGFHTLRHDRLTTLDDRELERAMTDGRVRLEAVVTRPLHTLAYPHGGGDERVARAARKAGFQYAFGVGGTPIGPDTHPHLLGRVAPSHSSLGRFALGLARTASPHSSPPMAAA